MSNLYRDILNGFKEIGELHNNQDVIDKANKYIKQLNIENSNPIKYTDEIHNVKINPKLIKNENIKPQQINIRQSLIELDQQDPEGFGILSDIYDNIILSITVEEKKKLASLIAQKRINDLTNYLTELSNKYNYGD